MTNRTQKKKPSNKRAPTEKRIAIIIVAHNEASVIEPLVLSVKNTLRSQDQVYVIADNCTDATAHLAAIAGASVRDRKTGGPDGKGAALQWFINQEKIALEEFNLLAILDADSQIPPGFIDKAKAAFIEGTVIQCYVQPISYGGSPISTLSALSEILEQKTFDRIRSWLGWPIRLRGTGMLIPPAILISVADQIQTEVEDIALSLLFASSGIPIKKTDKVSVYDPKTPEPASASRQRARWFRGQWIALWHYRSEVARLLARGPAGWSLLGSLFLKPRWLLDVIILLFGILFYFYSPIISDLLGLIVAFDVLCLVYTIARLEDKKTFIKAIFYFPAFILMWLRGFVLAFQKSSWVR